MQILTTVLAAALATAGGETRTKPETTVERLHRKGVFCQEEIDRPDCAMDKFEALLRERTTQRELVTDGMLRLVRLYQEAGEGELAKPMLRQFWSAGVKTRQTGHVPYSTKYLPDEIDMLFMIDVQDILGAPIADQMGPDAKAWVTTCDPGKRQLLWERRRWKRAERRAKEQGKETVEVIYEQQDEARERREQARKRAAKPEGDEEEERYDPVFGEGVCPLAKALGQEDVSTWRRMLGGMYHDDFRISLGIVEVPELAPMLESSETEGRLLKRADRVWALPDLDYYGEEVHVANLDRDELVVANESVMKMVLDSRAKQRRTIARGLDKLMGEIPRDSEFFFVMTEQAVIEMGFGGLDTSRRALLQALLPRPKGFQMAAVAHDYFGVFMRMPTDNAVKGAMLISLAKQLLQSDDEDDPEQKELMEQLDVSQTSDKRALLMSYVLNPGQVRRIFFY